MEIWLIAACDLQGAIGANNKLLWKGFAEDMRRFRACTMGRSVVMGRKTFESIGKALPGRHNIVMTRDTNWKAPDITIAHSKDQAIAAYKATHSQLPLMVIGGEDVYRQFLPVVTEIRLTVVDHIFSNADAFMPEFDLQRDFPDHIIHDDIVDDEFSYKFRFIDGARR